MQAREDAEHRLVIAEDDLVLARGGLEIGHWPVVVNYSQQVVENAVKAVLALVAPTPRSHEPAKELHDALGSFPEAVRPAVRRLARLGEPMGTALHIRAVHGDEDARLTPRQLFG